MNCEEQVRNTLAHHGILGQKWGVRRYQNADGSLTSAGQKKVSADYKKRPLLAIKNLLKTTTTFMLMPITRQQLR